MNGWMNRSVSLQLFSAVGIFSKSLSVICHDRWGSKKKYFKVWTHELTAYLSVFDLFLVQWIMAILSKGCKPDNFESHNSLKLTLQIFKAFNRIFLNVNLSLNEILLTFFLCVRQTKMTQLILAISQWGVTFL